MTIRGAMVAVLGRPEPGERIRELGYAAVGDQPEVFARFIMLGTLKANIEKWRKILREKSIGEGIERPPRA